MDNSKSSTSDEFFYYLIPDVLNLLISALITDLDSKQSFGELKVSSSDHSKSESKEKPLRNSSSRDEMKKLSTNSNEIEDSGQGIC